MVIRDPWIRALVIVMLLIAAVYLTSLLWAVAVQFADVILLFFLAWIIAFILEPMVHALHKQLGMPRNLAVLTTYLSVLVTVSLVIIQVVPRLSVQITQVTNDLPIYVAWANDELLKLQALLAQHGLYIAPESILSYQEIVRHAESVGPTVLVNTLGIATGVANLLFQVFIILIMSYYMTLDGRRISTALLLAVPRAYREDVQHFLTSVNRAFAGFMRGQVAQATVYGLGTAAIMSVLGVKLVLLCSIAAGVLMLLPFIGPILAMAMPLVVAAVTNPDGFWAMLIALFVLQQVVVNVIAPRLMSHAVGLHPLLVFLAFLGGAKVAGLWGAVFGIPVVGVVVAMASFYRSLLEERRAGDTTGRTVEGPGQFPGQPEPATVHHVAVEASAIRAGETTAPEPVSSAAMSSSSTEKGPALT